jgi:hypothetical protein
MLAARTDSYREGCRRIVEMLKLDSGVRNGFDRLLKHYAR